MDFEQYEKMYKRYSDKKLLRIYHYRRENFSPDSDRALLSVLRSRGIDESKLKRPDENSSNQGRINLELKESSLRKIYLGSLIGGFAVLSTVVLSKLGSRIGIGYIAIGPIIWGMYSILTGVLGLLKYSIHNDKQGKRYR